MLGAVKGPSSYTRFPPPRSIELPFRDLRASVSAPVKNDMDFRDEAILMRPLECGDWNFQIGGFTEQRFYDFQMRSLGSSVCELNCN